jgi:hypothetical protein
MSILFPPRRSHSKGLLQPKTILIGAVIAIALFASWRIFAGRVDRSNPDAVANAFFKALKANDIPGASKYWVPDGAEAWSTNTAKSIDQMQGGTFSRFFEDLPQGKQIFVSTRKPKSAANEQTLTAGNASLDMRQIDGKWYVFKSPI